MLVVPIRGTRMAKGLLALVVVSEEEKGQNILVSKYVSDSNVHQIEWINLHPTCTIFTCGEASRSIIRFRLPKFNSNLTLPFLILFTAFWFGSLRAVIPSGGTRGKHPPISEQII